MSTQKAKVSHDDDNFDFSKLEKEVQAAVSTDERYWRENDAKIRAVEQRVATYDEFREMVFAAHLKPLEKEDKISSIVAFTQVWNQAVRIGSQANVQTTQKDEDATKTKMAMPKSGQEFAQHWKRYCKTADERRQYLLAVGPRRSELLFQTEISGGLLGEFLVCLQDFETEQTPYVVELMQSFSKSQRFSLSLAFLSKNEKEACGALFEKLRAKVGDLVENEECLRQIEELETLYSGGKVS